MKYIKQVWIIPIYLIQRLKSWFYNKTLTQKIILVVSTSFLVLLVIPWLFTSRENGKFFLEVLQSSSLSVGAILGGLAGLTYLNQIGEQTKREKQRKYYKEKYPPSEQDITFQLIASSSNPGKIYMKIFETNNKHHIASHGTLDDLGYDGNKLQILNVDVFNSIPDGEQILTRGEIGT